MRGGWNQINTALRDAFEGVSLAAMTSPAMPLGGFRQLEA